MKRCEILRLKEESSPESYHSFTQHILSTFHVLGIIPGTGDPVNKNKDPAFM